MPALRVRPSTVQVTGTLISIFVGISGGYILYGVEPHLAVATGLMLSLLGVILTLTIDIYYGALGEGKRLQEAINAHPILKHYEDCMLYYEQLKRELNRNGEMGHVMGTWLDEKVQLHYRYATEDWKNGRLSFREDELAVRSIQMLKYVYTTGFATQLERYTGFWETAQDYLEDTRNLARNGRSITRVFILSSPDSLRNEALIKQITRDKEAGITTLIAYVASLANDAIRDFGIYDDRLVSIVSMTQVGARVLGCTYSMRQDDLQEANAWKEQILRVAIPPTFPLSPSAAPVA